MERQDRLLLGGPGPGDLTGSHGRARCPPFPFALFDIRPGRHAVVVITPEQVRSVMADGGRVVDSAGRPLGTIVDVVPDAESRGPEWLTLDPDEPGGTALVLPLAGARLSGGRVQVAYTVADVRAASAAARCHEDDLAGHRPASPGPWTAMATAGPPWWDRRQWRWPSVPMSVRAMRLELRPVLDLTGLPEDVLDDLVLAAAEAATNAVEHALFPTSPCFDVLTDVGEHRARIVIQDHGRWRTSPAPGDRGRGLQMIGVLAEATLTVGTGGTTVVLRNRSGSSL